METGRKREVEGGGWLIDMCVCVCEGGAVCEWVCGWISYGVSESRCVCASYSL